MCQPTSLAAAAAAAAAAGSTAAIAAIAATGPWRSARSANSRSRPNNTFQIFTNVQFLKDRFSTSIFRTQKKRRWNTPYWQASTTLMASLLLNNRYPSTPSLNCSLWVMMRVYGCRATEGQAASWGMSFCAWGSSMHHELERFALHVQT